MKFAEKARQIMIYRSGGIFARLYHRTYGAWFYPRLLERSLNQSDAAGLRYVRSELVSRARGEVLEIGAGLGHNLSHYQSQRVTGLYLLEPYAPLRQRLDRRVQTEDLPVAPGRINIYEGWAEDLPFADQVFDTVVMTMVLCTARDPGAVLDEVARVLAPGGKLLFLEHVQSADPRMARRQNRLQPFWYLLANGCHCNRATARTLQSGPLEVVNMRSGEIPGAPAIVRPMIRGVAVLRSAPPIQVGESVVEASLAAT